MERCLVAKKLKKGEKMDDFFNKQFIGLVENERKYYLRKDYQRKLTRYKNLDDSFKKKYKMDFEEFEKEIIAEIEKNDFEVESDTQEWRAAVNEIKILEKKEDDLIKETLMSFGIVNKNETWMAL
ncbi:MAG: hypothetical protein V1872_02270 [bacterium]